MSYPCQFPSKKLGKEGDQGPGSGPYSLKDGGGDCCGRRGDGDGRHVVAVDFDHGRDAGCVGRQPVAWVEIAQTRSLGSRNLPLSPLFASLNLRRILPDICEVEKLASKTRKKITFTKTREFISLQKLADLQSDSIFERYLSKTLITEAVKTDCSG